MTITSLSIKGLRGFSQEQAINFAEPNGEIGSGFTILVGPNNGGKSTVIESLRALSMQENPTFSEGKRNKWADDSISLIANINGEIQQLKTVETGGSQTVREPANRFLKNCYVLPSRRFFRPYFNQGESNRQQYSVSYGLPDIRSSSLDQFSQRLFVALEKLDDFNAVLGKVVEPPTKWTIDQSDQGGYFLKVDSFGLYHNSDGLGEGIVSLLFIVDAVYDSTEGEIIVIDEPELSLHPAYQRRLANLLSDYARTRQIILATHSPYFIDFQHVLNGAEVIRVHQRNGSSITSQLTRETAKRLEGLMQDTHNPHVLGLDAREVFFKDDGVVVVEGQEDVIYYPRVLRNLVDEGKLSSDFETFFQERFFGWGAGGASKIEIISALLNDLGFQRVAGILDMNEEHRIPKLQSDFENYTYLAIPADDVRTKSGSSGAGQTVGLLDDKGKIRAEYVERAAEIFATVSKRLRVYTN